jgi:hypothetical protein
MQVTLQALPAAERRQITTPLLEGRSADSRALVEHLATLRAGKTPTAAAS